MNATPREVIFTIDHEQGLCLTSPQVMHDGPEHRIERFFVDTKERGASFSVSAWPFAGGPTTVIVTSSGGSRLQVKVPVPDRLFGDRDRYFAAAALDGRIVTVIVAAMDWERHASDRPERTGSSITGDVSF